MDMRAQAEAVARGDVREVLAHRLLDGHDGQPEGLVALSLLYVGDQVGQVATEVAAVRGVLMAAGQALGTFAGPVSHLFAGVAQFAEQVAPATRNGAGEVIARTIDVAAALRADYGAEAAKPAAMDGEG